MLTENGEPTVHWIQGIEKQGITVTSRSLGLEKEEVSVEGNG